MRFNVSLGCLALLVLPPWLATPLLADVPHARQRGNLDVACTQGGLKQRTLPGKAYPMRMEFVGGYGQPLAGAIVTVSRGDGADLVGVACTSARVLMRLPAGRYMATADMTDGPTKTVTFDVTRAGPKTTARTLVVHFPSMMGAGSS
jgi:hypothetical protein